MIYKRSICDDLVLTLGVILSDYGPDFILGHCGVTTRLVDLSLLD